MLGLICMVMLAYLWHQNIAPFVGDVGGDGRDGGQRDGVGFQGPGQAHGPPVQVLHVQDGWLIWSSNIKQTYNYRLFLDTVQRRLQFKFPYCDSSPVEHNHINDVEEKTLEDKIFSPECSLVTSQRAAFEKHKWQNNLLGIFFGALPLFLWSSLDILILPSFMAEKTPFPALEKDRRRHGQKVTGGWLCYNMTVNFTLRPRACSVCACPFLQGSCAANAEPACAT